MPTDLQFATDNQTALVRRGGGSRQEVVDNFLRAWETLGSPAIPFEPDPRRLELEKALAPLIAGERDRYQSTRETVEAEFRRPFEERLTTAEDDDEKHWIAAKMNEELSDQRSAVAEAINLRLAPPDPRAVAIRQELAQIDRDDRQRTRAQLVKQAAAMRHALSVPVTPDIVMQALDRLAGQHKWPAGQDRRTFLAVMAEQVEGEGFSPVVVAQAVLGAATKYDWVPSIKQMLDDCWEIARSLWAQVWLMESTDPTKYRALLLPRLEEVGQDKRKDETENVKRLAYNELKAFNQRDPAPEKYR